MTFAKVYPLYVNKAEKKGRSQSEVNQIIEWLMGYTEEDIQEIIKTEIDIESFIKNAPKLNPNRKFIKGVVCSVRVEEVKEKLMREIRYLDKLIDELARGKKMESILRTK
jgi:hypothetical protein